MKRKVNAIIPNSLPGSSPSVSMTQIVRKGTIQKMVT